VKIGFKFQSLGKISNISTSDTPPPPVILSQYWALWAVRCRYSYELTTVSYSHPDLVKIYGFYTSVNTFLPKFCPKVTYPLLIWASEAFDGTSRAIVAEWLDMTQKRAMVSISHNEDMDCPTWLF